MTWNVVLPEPLERCYHCGMKRRVATGHHSNELTLLNAKLAAVESQSDLLRRACEQAELLLLIVRGPDFVIEFANSAYQDLVGHRDLLGKPAREALPELVGQGLFPLLEDVYRRGVPFTGEELPIDLMRDGSLKTAYFNFTYQPIRGADGAVDAILMTATEVTAQVRAKQEAADLTRALEQRNRLVEAQVTERTEQLRRAYDQLKELDRLKSNFVNSVSHELRTPLTSILGYAEFLEDRIGGDLTLTQQDFVHQIQASSNRLMRLLDDLLDFARMDAGTFILHVRAFDLRDKVAAIAASLRPQAEAAQLTLQTELPDGPLPIRGDAQRVGQVLINLINNAIKFTPPGGTIRVRTHPLEGGQGVRCEVVDTGPGIAEADLPKLFQRFSQVGPQAAGSGLGLSISKALVEAHGGQIGVMSGLGRGATFWFTLPGTPSDRT
ncbi:Alkaline phosphatase synthesis sensor protein PhoR [compost metagenome]